MAQEGLTVRKKWGTEQYVTNTEHYCCKFLILDSMKVCSRHRHLKKTETFHVHMGSGWIEVGDRLYKVKERDVVHIPPGTWHRFWTEECMVLLEVSTHHEDEDVERATESDDIYRVTEPVEGIPDTDTAPSTVQTTRRRREEPIVPPSTTQPWFNSMHGLTITEE